jgi:hypothetical protein
VTKLTPAQADIMMKFVYKLMDIGDSSLYSGLLKWHFCITEKFGLGSISRVLAEQPAL